MYIFATINVQYCISYAHLYFFHWMQVWSCPPIEKMY